MRLRWILPLLVGVCGCPRATKDVTPPRDVNPSQADQVRNDSKPGGRPLPSPPKVRIKDAAYVEGFQIVRCDAPTPPSARRTARFPLFGKASLKERRGRAAEYKGDWNPGPEELEYVATLPPALRELCFSITPGEVPPEQRDHIAVLAMSSPAGTTESFFQFDAQKVREQFGEYVPPPSLSSAQRARLTILDTAPTAGPSVGGGATPFDRTAVSEHGSTLANIAGALACGSETTRGPDVGQTNCGFSIHTALALPEVAGLTAGASAYSMLPSSTGSGYIGSIAELADAVQSAVSTYRSDTGRADALGLVINLSLGFGKAWDVATNADVIALHSALMRARCDGALILAAEGHGYTPGYPTEMLTPARWFKRSNEPGGGSDTTPHDCSTYADATFTPARWDGLAPLVYPVGGVVQGTPTMSGTPTFKEPFDVLPGFPRSTLRAFSASSSAKLPSFSNPAPQPAVDEFSLSANGTSVATLLVSTAAAFRWGAGHEACNQGWPTTVPFGTGSATTTADLYLAEELMVDLRAGCGTGTPPASFVRVTGGAPFTRVTATDTVRTCSTTVSTACANAVAPSATPPTVPPTPALSCTLATGVSGCVSTAIRRCGPTPPISTKCATTDIYSTSAVDWVSTMPPPPFCPACVAAPPPTIGGTWKLFTEYPPTLGSDPTTASATLVLANKSGAAITPVAEYVDLGVPRSGAGNVAFPGPAASAVNVAWLSVFDAAGNSTSCPVRVLGSTP